MRLKTPLLCALPLVATAAILPSALSASAATDDAWSVRINAGGAAFTDTAGKAWLADRDFIGGTAATSTAPVAYTADQTPYKTQRYGMSGYKIPVPSAGTYKLTLRFAEGWATAPDVRVFSVAAEGQPVVSNLDLVKVIGANTAYDVTVPVRTADAYVDLAFSATKNNALINGIQVEAMSATQTTATPTATPTASPTAAPTTPPPTTAPAPTPTKTDPWPLVGTRHLYVSGTGSDAATGTATSPLRTINKASSLATAGTIVHVGPGTYGYTETTKSGTSTAPITYVSDTTWGAKVVASGSTNAWTNTGAYVVIQGFDISGSKYSGIMSTSSYGKFLGNHIHHMAPPDCSRGGAGIELQNYSGTKNDSIGNVIHDILAPSSNCGLIHGIYYQGPDGGKVSNNLVYQTSGWGIHLWHNANRVMISNNTVFQNKQGGMVIGGSLEGNDIAPGISSGNVVTNNVVVNNGYWGIREMGRVGVNTYANNLLNGNASGGYSVNGGGVPTGTVTGDPAFVNYVATGGGDYRLRTTSPAIDRGTTNQAPLYDLDLYQRPQGSTMDIGAYEGGH
jgi:parallel beta-helix repeat protein